MGHREEGVLFLLFFCGVLLVFSLEALSSTDTHLVRRRVAGPGVFVCAQRQVANKPGLWWRIEMQPELNEKENVRNPRNVKRMMG